MKHLATLTIAAVLLTACEKQTEIPRMSRSSGRHPHPTCVAHQTNRSYRNRVSIPILRQRRRGLHLRRGIRGTVRGDRIRWTRSVWCSTADTLVPSITGRSPRWLGTHLWLTTCQLRAYEVSLSVRPLPTHPRLQVRGFAGRWQQDQSNETLHTIRPCTSWQHGNEVPSWWVKSINR